jgi:HTH-type transcriptional regulator/antitoxin HipB
VPRRRQPSVPDVAELVRSARAERSIGQRELARLAGMKQPAISRLERRHSTPRLEVLSRVAAAMGLVVEIRLVPHR